ncbi:MAG: radical SAM family heme chaperone HemW [Phycisphaerae bacterium]
MDTSDGRCAAGEGRCGLYIHIPFCVSKCGYCDFYSIALKNRDSTPFVQRLCLELASRVGGTPYHVRTVYVGGGTPTAIPVDQLKTLLRTVSRVIPVDALDEYTVEANPATVDNTKAELFENEGVTRVSLGAQSFIARELTALERLHTPDDIAPSIDVLRSHGIGRVNLDLIFGIPGQTLDSWRKSLRRTLDLGVEHISAYGLTYEPGTPLHDLRRRRLVTPCTEKLETELYLAADDLLTSAGYEHYEISSYAKPGGRCRHNLIYWRNEGYIGVGPSAAGCLDRRRYKNVSDLDEYVRMMDELGHAEDEAETLDVPTVLTEVMMLQLRLTEGMSVASLHDLCGGDALEWLSGVLPHLLEQGLVTRTDTHIALTSKGRLVGDAVVRELASSIPSVGL